MLTVEETPFGEHGSAVRGGAETLVIIRRGSREVGSLVLSERTSGGVGVEVWQYADDAHPLYTVEIPPSK